MKQYTTPVLEVTFDVPDSTVATVDFIFKQHRKQSDPVLVSKKYPGDVERKDGVYLVPMTEAETALFAADKTFYMDTRIISQNGKIPETPIVALFMNETLFSFGEV